MSKSMMGSALIVGLLVLGGSRSLAGEAQPSAKDQEAKLIAVLKSDAQLKDKADACRLLARVATKDAVPVLAGLLGDEKLGHMARYALEPLPDPAADEALRDALGKLKGLRLVGVINSLGVRRDAKAVGALAGLLGDADADVAQAAARALGTIGTAAAAKAVEGALPKAPAGNQVAFCEGLLRCAEALAATGEAKEALGVYDRLRALKPAPHQVRTGALRGAVLLRKDDGVPLLVEAIRGDDLVLVEAAARTAMEMPGSAAVTKALADELGKLPADKQILLTLAMGKRGDAGAVPALLALAKKGEKSARIAAVRALPEIGSATAVPALVALQADEDREVAQAAQDSLVAMPGEEVDAAIASMLTKGDADTRRIAIEQLGQRRTPSAVPALLKAAADADEGVRVASLKALGDLAGAAELPALIGLLMNAKSPAELRAAEGALSGACGRQAEPAVGKVVIVKAVYGALPDGPSADVTKKLAELVKAGSLTVEASNGNFGDPANGIAKKLRVEYTVEGAPQIATVNENDSITFTAKVTPPACIDALCAALAKAPSAPKLALLRVLRSAGGAKALEVVRTATADADAEVKDGATSFLCDWPTADALPDVVKLAKTSTSPRLKILALRGWIRLAPQQNAPAEQKLASLKEALALADRKEEKKLGLAALGVIPTVDALAVVAPYLENADVKEEACLAAVAIADRLVRRNPTEVAKAMEKVTQETENRALAKRARGLLDQAKKAVPRR